MEIVERAEVLRRTELFSNLRIEDLAGLATLVEEREYSDQEVLFDEGRSDEGSSSSSRGEWRP